jgi:phenylalanyl-tRNA synthetase alpha chain
MSLPDQTSVEKQIATFEAELARAPSAREAQAVRDRFLGRKNSVVASWMQMIGGAPPDQKREIGRFANELKQAIEERWAAYLAGAEMNAMRAGAAGLDVTLPGRVPPFGHRHPLTVVRDRMEEIFTRMGFAIVEGPEVEDEWHCFDALNMPAEHPARDMQDTLYLATPMPGDPEGPADPRTLLRTHTSSMQIRYMQAHAPPIRIVEGSRLRFRPSFFPYTEPSAEVDISCWKCDGAGCALCKRSGWLEILGCGMVHPAVFEAVGYDAEKYTGFAWGMGIERVAILRYQVEDIRLFYENDLRFLEQFPY